MNKKRPQRIVKEDQKTDRCNYCKKWFLLSEITLVKQRRKKRRACNDCRVELESLCKREMEPNHNPKMKKKKSHRKEMTGDTYEERNSTLYHLGFSSYAEYLESDLWKKIRDRVYKMKGRGCLLCERPATELHHNRYHKNDLLGKTLSFIHPICRDCHLSIEYDRDKKVSAKTAAKRFDSLRELHCGSAGPNHQPVTKPQKKRKDLTPVSEYPKIVGKLRDENNMLSVPTSCGGYPMGGGACEAPTAHFSHLLPIMSEEVSSNPAVGNLDLYTVRSS